LQIKDSYLVKFNQLNSLNSTLLARSNELKRKQLDLLKSNESDRQTYNNLNNKVSELKEKESYLNSQKQQQLNEINKLNKEIDSIKSKLNDLNQNHKKNSSLDLTLLNYYQSFLGLKINSTDNDIISFIFFNLIENDLDQNFAVVLDLSNDINNSYKIVQTSPALPENELADILLVLNKSRNIVLFLKNIRNLFID
ncbi:uncharacterized protein ASCRUDRAFT_26610, partial [Ascoidea rubescens DSM 1968]